MSELVFDVIQDSSGVFIAEAFGENIVTQADSWDELRDMVIDATQAYFFDSEPPKAVRLHLVRDEFTRLTLAAVPV